MYIDRFVFFYNNWTENLQIESQKLYICLFSGKGALNCQRCSTLTNISKVNNFEKTEKQEKVNIADYYTL